MIPIRKVDLHMHTTVSDGSDTPAEILSRVKEAGIDLFAVTDHDDVKGCQIIRSLRKEGDPYFICGAEFSCRDEQGKYHILGYRYDPDSGPIRHLIGKAHGLRMEKVTARLDFIRSEFGFVFPEEEIETLLSMDNPGKPHIGNLMVKYGYARTKDEAIKQYLDRIRLRSKYILPEEAIAGILGGGGIPVLAHPFFGDGDQLIVGEEMERRLARLLGFGLQGVEAYYSGFTPKLTDEMLTLAKRYGTYVTAGSDYHGKNKLVELGDTGLDENTAPAPGLERFLEAVQG